jgi:hypothetical protein
MYYVYTGYVAQPLMTTAMPDDAGRAYTWALIFAIVHKDVSFEFGDLWADWFTTRGRHTYGKDLDAAWEHFVTFVSRA